MASEDVTRVCQTYAVDGLRVLSESSPARPLRYIYLSGMLSERDQTKRPTFAAEYCLMRVSSIPCQLYLLRFRLCTMLTSDGCAGPN